MTLILARGHPWHHQNLPGNHWKIKTGEACHAIICNVWGNDWMSNRLRDYDYDGWNQLTHNRKLVTRKELWCEVLGGHWQRSCSNSTKKKVSYTARAIDWLLYRYISKFTQLHSWNRWERVCFGGSDICTQRKTFGNNHSFVGSYHPLHPIHAPCFCHRSARKTNTKPMPELHFHHPSTTRSGSKNSSIPSYHDCH